MSAIFEAINGRKTYIVSIVGILILVLVNVFGMPILDIQPDPNWMDKLWTLILVMTGRSALKKLET